MTKPPGTTATLKLPIRYFRFYPGDCPHGETFDMVQIDPRQTALLLVDVYHAAEKPEAKDLVNTTWERAFWDIVDKSLVPLIDSTRELGLPVIYLSNSSPRIAIKESAFGERLLNSLGFDPTIDFREKEVDAMEFDAGDPIQLFIPPQIAPRPGDYFMRKHTYSGFFDTRLDTLLRNLGIKTIISAGFAADVCVLFTLADAVFRGYHTILARDGTLAAELPEEVSDFKHTRRTITWMESFLTPTTTTEEFCTAVRDFQEQEAG
jgi:nicotinamidase-related amidase